MQMIALVGFVSLLFLGCATIPQDSSQGLLLIDHQEQEQIVLQGFEVEQELLPQVSQYPQPPASQFDLGSGSLPLPSLAPMHSARKVRMQPLDITASSRPVPELSSSQNSLSPSLGMLPSPNLDAHQSVHQQQNHILERSALQSNETRGTLPIISMPPLSALVPPLDRPEEIQAVTDSVEVQQLTDIVQPQTNQFATPQVVIQTPQVPSARLQEPRSATVVPTPSTPPTPIGPTATVITPEPISQRTRLEAQAGESLSVELEGFGWMLVIQIPDPTNKDFPQELRSTDWPRHGFLVNQEFLQRAMRFTLESNAQSPTTFTMVFRRTSIADGFSEERIYDVETPGGLLSEAQRNIPLISSPTREAVNSNGLIDSSVGSPRAIEVVFPDSMRDSLTQNNVSALQGTYEVPNPGAGLVEPENIDVRFSGLPDDERLFRMAGEYELRRTSTSLRRSLELYRELLIRFPFSDFSHQASTRMRVLERQFSMIR